MKIHRGDVIVDDKFGCVAIAYEPFARDWCFAKAYIVDSEIEFEIGVDIHITDIDAWRVVDNVGGDL